MAADVKLPGSGGKVVDEGQGDIARKRKAAKSVRCTLA
jgi:hypothetical protein